MLSSPLQHGLRLGKWSKAFKNLGSHIWPGPLLLKSIFPVFLYWVTVEITMDWKKCQWCQRSCLRFCVLKGLASLFWEWDNIVRTTSDITCYQWCCPLPTKIDGWQTFLELAVIVSHFNLLIKMLDVTSVPLHACIMLKEKNVILCFLM